MLLQSQHVCEKDILSNMGVKHILLVDDDSIVRGCIREFLELQGYHCTEAHNGAIALEALANNSFSLIITDNQMPVMDGIAFLEAHHANEGCLTPTIMVTGNLTPTLEARAARIDVKSVFEKPCSFETLLEAISDAIEV
ncbi:response regulator [Nitrospira sp. M1]